MPTASHIHTAPVGVDGGITFDLTLTSATTADDTWTPTTAQPATLRTAGIYVNVHSAMFPGGEIRGQLLPAVLPVTSGGGCQGSNGVLRTVVPSGGALPTTLGIQ
jgi:hypothetical protein